MKQNSNCVKWTKSADPFQCRGIFDSFPGRDHASFADGPFYSPLNSASLSSGVGAETAARIISRYVISFFDRQFGRATDDTLSHPPAEVPGSALKEFAPGG